MAKLSVLELQNVTFATCASFAKSMSKFPIHPALVGTMLLKEFQTVASNMTL